MRRTRPPKRPRRSTAAPRSATRGSAESARWRSISARTRGNESRNRSLRANLRDQREGVGCRSWPCATGGPFLFGGSLCTSLRRPRRAGHAHFPANRPTIPAASREPLSHQLAIPQHDARREEAPLLARSGAVLRPRRWECVDRETLQGVCGSAVQLSDRRDRVLLLVLSVLRRALTQQMGDPQSCGG